MTSLSQTQPPHPLYCLCTRSRNNNNYYVSYAPTHEMIKIFTSNSSKNIELKKYKIATISQEYFLNLKTNT